MAKRFSPEFKQQAIDYTLANSHESLTSIAVKLGVGYSTLDKWIRLVNPDGSSKRQLKLNSSKRGYLSALKSFSMQMPQELCPVLPILPSSSLKPNDSYKPTAVPSSSNVSK